MQYLEIGQIVNTFGIKGQVKVVPFTDDITRFDYLKKVYIVNKKLRKEVEVENVKYHKDMVLLKFKGLDRIEDVEIYKNSYLEIDRKDAKPLEEGEYYIVDLIGLDVITDEGQNLGKVDDIYNTGSNDIYVVKDELGKQILLPSIKDVIKKVDLENKKINVHIIEGLIDK
ncbi:MAG: ribosome maturation factor RimM [Clostridia bacterium]|nr:ribosome maturation factor RimM [Clostridia bacterium]